MQAGQLIVVRTNPATQLAGPLAQNVAATVNLTPPTAGSLGGDGFVDEGLAAGRSVQGICRAISLASVDNLAWEVSLWANSTFNGSATDPAQSALLGLHRFVVGDGLQIGGAGLYYYYADPLRIPIFDANNLGDIHLMLVNRSAGAKAGAILVALDIEATYGR